MTDQADAPAEDLPAPLTLVETLQNAKRAPNWFEGQRWIQKALELIGER